MIHPWAKYIELKSFLVRSIPTPAWAHMPTNDEIILASRDSSEVAKSNLDLLKQETEDAHKLFLEKRDAYVKMHSLYNVSAKIDEIYKGSAIGVCWRNRTTGSESIDIKPICFAKTNPRYAKIYRNQHNKVTWGLQLSKLRDGPGSNDKFMGYSYKTYEECKAIALNWVACGSMKSES